MSSDSRWERFARVFWVWLVALFLVIGFGVTFLRPERERYIFPVSAMPMFRGVPPLTPAQKQRLEAVTE